MSALGRPRLHLRTTASTNDRARELAAGGAPHGTLVTAGVQTAGRGRQGRAWSAPPGRALLLSLIVREADALLPLRAGLAVADVAGAAAQVKWPNDVLLDGRKLAGVLVEGRPQEDWAVVGIGLNVAIDLPDLPPEIRGLAATLGRTPAELEPTLHELLRALELRLAEPPAGTVEALRARDALRGHTIAFSGGTGAAAGIDDAGRLLVTLADGSTRALDSGEVHLGTPTSMSTIEVYRHGGRWAVRRQGDTMPEGEYDTRKLAETAARGLGGDVITLDDAEGGAAGEPAQAGETDVMDRSGGGSEERGRLPQAGL